MPNIRASFSSGQGQQSGVQPLPSFPPLAQNNLHSDLMLKSQEVEVPAVQLPILSQSKYQQQGPAPVLPGTSTVFPPHSQNMMNMSARPHIQAAATPYAKQQVQPYMFQHQSQAVPAKLGHNNSQLVHPQGIREPFLVCPLLLNFWIHGCILNPSTIRFWYVNVCWIKILNENHFHLIAQNDEYLKLIFIFSKCTFTT